MTIARYYVQRLTQARPGDSDVLTFAAPGNWMAAMIRGTNVSNARLTTINFVGQQDRALLTVVDALVGSTYEIVLSTHALDPSDQALIGPRKPSMVGAGISLDNAQTFRNWNVLDDRDPPPPPPLAYNWSFLPPVSIT